MSVTKYLPLGISDVWYGSSSIAANAMLLRNDVTSISETVMSASDLYTYEISTGGGYTAGATGVAMAPLERVQDATTGVVEYNCGTPAWQSTDSLTIASYRWVVAMAGSIPIAIWNLGVDSSLSATPLQLILSVSPYITGSYPLLRFKRNTA